MHHEVTSLGYAASHDAGTLVVKEIADGETLDTLTPEQFHAVLHRLRTRAHNVSSMQNSLTEVSAASPAPAPYSIASGLLTCHLPHVASCLC